jgi:hypothetical protein
MGAGLHPQEGYGLLANLGLTLYQVVETQVLPAPEVDITPLGKPQTGEVGK